MTRRLARHARAAAPLTPALAAALIAAAAAALVLAPAHALAADWPSAKAAADTSKASAAEPPPSPFPAPVARVEPRQLIKEKRLFFTAGPTFLYRRDYYDSPGIVGTAAYYSTEKTGFEFTAAWFGSSRSAAAQQVFATEGWIPDSRRPIGLLALGWRPTLINGKFLAGRESVVYFDAHLGLRGGILLTDGPVAPTLAVAPGFLIRLSDRFFLAFEVGVPLSFESRRHGMLALGAMPVLALGVTP